MNHYNLYIVENSVEANSYWEMHTYKEGVLSTILRSDHLNKLKEYCKQNDLPFGEDFINGSLRVEIKEVEDGGIPYLTTNNKVIRASATVWVPNEVPVGVASNPIGIKQNRILSDSLGVPADNVFIAPPISAIIIALT